MGNIFKEISLLKEWNQSINEAETDDEGPKIYKRQSGMIGKYLPNGELFPINSSSDYDNYNGKTVKPQHLQANLYTHLMYQLAKYRAKVACLYIADYLLKIPTGVKSEEKKDLLNILKDFAPNQNEFAKADFVAKCQMYINGTWIKVIENLESWLDRDARNKTFDATKAKALYDKLVANTVTDSFYNRLDGIGSLKYIKFIDYEGTQRIVKAEVRVSTHHVTGDKWCNHQEIQKRRNFGFGDAAKYSQGWDDDKTYVIDKGSPTEYSTCIDIVYGGMFDSTQGTKETQPIENNVNAFTIFIPFGTDATTIASMLGTLGEYIAKVNGDFNEKRNSEDENKRASVESRFSTLKRGIGASTAIASEELASYNGGHYIWYPCVMSNNQWYYVNRTIVRAAGFFMTNFGDNSFSDFRLYNKTLGRFHVVEVENNIVKLHFSGKELSIDMSLFCIDDILNNSDYVLKHKEGDIDSIDSLLSLNDEGCFSSAKAVDKGTFSVYRKGVDDTNAEPLFKVIILATANTLLNNLNFHRKGDTDNEYSLSGKYYGFMLAKKKVYVFSDMSIESSESNENDNVGLLQNLKKVNGQRHKGQMYVRSSSMMANTQDAEENPWTTTAGGVVAADIPKPKEELDDEVYVLHDKGNAFYIGRETQFESLRRFERLLKEASIGAESEDANSFWHAEGITEYNSSKQPEKRRQIKAISYRKNYPQESVYNQTMKLSLLPKELEYINSKLRAAGLTELVEGENWTPAEEIKKLVSVLRISNHRLKDDRNTVINVHVELPEDELVKESLIRRCMLNEALTPLQKMQMWHDGTRICNVGACSVAKLRMYLQICEEQGFTREANTLRRQLSYLGEGGGESVTREPVSVSHAEAMAASEPASNQCVRRPYDVRSITNIVSSDNVERSLQNMDDASLKKCYIYALSYGKTALAEACKQEMAARKNQG